MSPRRQLSEFLCREMLYDFATGELDDSRKTAVEESIKEFPDLEDELEALKNGIVYLKLLSQTEVSEPLINQVQEETGIVAYFKKLQTLPTWARWTIEALVVASVVFIGIRFIPTDFWMKDVSQFDVATVQLGKGQAEIPISDEVSEVEKMIQKDEEALPKEGVIVEATPAPVKKSEEVISKDESVASNKTTLEAKDPPSAVPVRGYVYRMYMFLSNVDEVTPVIAKKIRELGGKKAGEVRLGWRKEDGSYFHFTLPEEKYSEITSFVSQYGDVRISKDEHKRIMPRGINRFILWIEETNPNLRKKNDESGN